MAADCTSFIYLRPTGLEDRLSGQFAFPWAQGLEAFEDVGDQGAGEVAGEALDGGGILLDEAG